MGHWLLVVLLAAAFTLTFCRCCNNADFVPGSVDWSDESHLIKLNYSGLKAKHYVFETKESSVEVYNDESDPKTVIKQLLTDSERTDNDYSSSGKLCLRKGDLGLRLDLSPRPHAFTSYYNATGTWSLLLILRPFGANNSSFALRSFALKSVYSSETANSHNVTLQSVCNSDRYPDWYDGSRHHNSFDDPTECHEYRCTVSFLQLSGYDSIFFMDLDIIVLFNKDGQSTNNIVVPKSTCYTKCGDVINPFGPHHSPDYDYPRNHNSVFFAVVRLLLYVVVVAVIVKIVVKLRRERKERQRRALMTPTVGYFCPPNNNQTVTPQIQPLYIIPPLHYGLDQAGGEEKPAENQMIFH